MISRYRPRYRDNTWPDIRVCPDIAFSDIVSPRHDIVIFFPISEPISGKKTPISVQYRDIPVPCQTRYYQYRARYRVFSRYRYRYRVNIGTYPFLAKPDIGFFTYIGPDMVPILQKISGYTDIGTKQPRNRSRCHSNVYAISQYTDIVSLLRLRPPPAAQALTRTRRPLSRPRLVQPVGPQLCRPKGQCLGYCLHACAQRATAEIALVSGGATYSESLAKLET